MKTPEDLNLIIQDQLLAIPKFGKGVGLHRMLALCGLLFATDWMKNLDAIKVTGSNGKGSVCAMAAEILKQLEVTCGLYTSPHLIKFNERIAIDGVPISDLELRDAVEWFFQRREEYQTSFPEDVVGAFEAFTAIALFHFARKRPRAIVAEAGIGGRYDSTRVIPGRFVALTSLDLEHTSLLGDTREMIGYDKADLCPNGGVIVAGAIDAEVLRRLRPYCALRNVTVRSAVEHLVLRRVAFGETYMEADLQVDGLEITGLRMTLQGYHQITNLAVTILLLREWLAIHEPMLSEERFVSAVRRAMSSLSFPGRFERIGRHPDTFIDVGHTPEAIASLVRTAETVFNGRRVLLVTGVSYDKDVEGIVTRLLPMADSVICTRAHHKGSPPEKILQIVQSANPEIPAFSVGTIEDAIHTAREYAAENDMVVMVAGGLFLSIEAKYALDGNDPQDLRFF